MIRLERLQKGDHRGSNLARMDPWSVLHENTNKYSRGPSLTYSPITSGPKLAQNHGRTTRRNVVTIPWFGMIG